MFKRKLSLFAAVLVTLFVVFFARPGLAYAEGISLKAGMSGEKVTMLQRNLKSLGYFEYAPTGYFGSLTKSAVVNFQKQNDLNPDGIAGSRTLDRINSLLKRKPSVNRGGVERGDTSQTDKIVLLPWFEKVNGIFKIGDTARVTDLDTGLSFMVKRTYGVNHADVEALTSKDTGVLKKIAGGEWNWTRRAAVVEIDGYKIAASITARPHAGLDDGPAGAVVKGRSGDYGKGENFDNIKGNNMDGHFDIHFSGSRTHATNKVDKAHQQMVKKAYESDKN